MAILNDTTIIGLANRFLVTIDPGAWNLGSWQKAEGLDVAWDMPDYRAGDAGNARWFFPANTKYSSVRLSRAACPDSATVRDWLNKNSFSADVPGTPTRCTVTVELYDSAGKTAVCTWELRHALPKKWSINSMDAGASQVSVETIEFDHEGFLDDEVKIGG